MKQKQVLLIYVIAILSMVIPLPARTGCGIIMILFVNLIMFSSTGVKVLLTKIETGKLDTVIIMVFMAAITIICMLLLVFYSLILVFIMSFVIFLAPVSSFLICYFHTKS